MLRPLFLAAAMLAAPASGQVHVGRPAPDFTLANGLGAPVTLSTLRGRTVVLEWSNPGCPFVQKHYRSGSMQRTQGEARRAGVVWLTINSGAPGKQGYLTAPEARNLVSRERAQTTAYLLDPQGRVGRMYGARTTPHMYLIDPAGRLVYQGGIDDRPTADPADIKAARNHVLAALTELRSGKPVSVAETRPYGCSVKYAG